LIVQTESYPRDAFVNWQLVQTYPYILGDFVWTAWDYLGEAGIGRYYYSGEPAGEHWENNLFPWHGAYCGDIDLTGWRKPISHYRNMLWNPTEKLYMAVREPDPVNGQIHETSWSVWPAWESWTWPGQEGKMLQVELYSRYPEVRLYLNGQLIKAANNSSENAYKVVVSVPYSPGQLKAVGVTEKREVDSVFLTTAGQPANIRATADRTRLIADGQDLCFITLEIIDRQHRLQPNAENRLYFSLEGPGGHWLSSEPPARQDSFD
jgi:beta-galactosidase